MGGYGSGRVVLNGKRGYLDDYLDVDVRKWKREGLLRSGASFVTRWEVAGRKSQSIAVRVEDMSVILIFQQRDRGGDWEKVEQRVYLIYTPCNFGGERVWFRCPRCGRKSAKLYHLSRFECRHCANFSYRSQGETTSDRSLRKCRGVRRKLGAGINLTEPIFLKPKGMHWKTFSRLALEARRLEQAVFEKLSLNWRKISR